MKAIDLLIGFGSVKDSYVISAEEFRQGKKKAQIKRLSTRKMWLIAAIIALALLLVGCCAIIAMRLQHLTIREETASIPSETSFNGEALSLISIQGFMGTDSYAAFKEWQDFLSTYDLDKSILHTNNDFQAPEAYFSYSCYSQEMIDKIDEICEKYHLQPLGKPWFFDRGEDVFDAVGIESVCNFYLCQGGVIEQAYTDSHYTPFSVKIGFYSRFL